MLKANLDDTHTHLSMAAFKTEKPLWEVSEGQSRKANTQCRRVFKLYLFSHFVASGSTPAPIFLGCEKHAFIVPRRSGNLEQGYT